MPPLAVANYVEISIHALLTEGDRTSIAFFSTFPLFQSTPSSRRATVSLIDSASPSIDFNPRPPHGGRRSADRRFSLSPEFQSTPSSRRATPSTFFYLTPSLIISIHALLTEGDAYNIIVRRYGTYFNPRPPHGGRLGAHLIARLSR